MALTSDIVESWHSPRRVVRRLRGAGRSEPFVFTFLFVFLLMAIVSAAPLLARQAALEHGPVAPRLLGAVYGAVIAVPILYSLAALGHLVARLMGGTGSFYDGRLALFWALICTTPAMLVCGLARALTQNTLGVTILGFLTLAVFLIFYSVMLREVEGQ